MDFLKFNGEHIMPGMALDMWPGPNGGKVGVSLDSAKTSFDQVKEKTVSSYRAFKNQAKNVVHSIFRRDLEN